MQRRKYKPNQPVTQIVDDLYVSAFGNGFHGILRCHNWVLPCRLGRSGRKVLKREGDGATPIGAWPIRYGFYRPDRVRRPNSAIPFYPISPNDGWCDEPSAKDYNQPVTLPTKNSAESMWRDDALYDLVIVLGHNDDPVIADMGSAVFFHLTRDRTSPTAGCVAIELASMQKILPLLAPGTMMHIT